LIFLDVIMPELEGPDVFVQIKNNAQTKDIPVVFLTATVTKEEVEFHDGKIGGRTFMAKPSSLPELIDCIERHVQPIG
jgi:two-component system sensor histidine kinase/response regulator